VYSGPRQRAAVGGLKVVDGYSQENRKGEDGLVARCFQVDKHTTAIARERTSWRGMETSL
jgi:hypothetical protein